jgi:hypothetical protein
LAASTAADVLRGDKRQGQIDGVKAGQHPVRKAPKGAGQVLDEVASAQERHLGVSQLRQDLLGAMQGQHRPRAFGQFGAKRGQEDHVGHTCGSHGRHNGVGGLGLIGKKRGHHRGGNQQVRTVHTRQGLLQRLGIPEIGHGDLGPLLCKRAALFGITNNHPDFFSCGQQGECGGFARVSRDASNCEHVNLLKW